jgi:hypothetical protein
MEIFREEILAIQRKQCRDHFGLRQIAGSPYNHDAQPLVMIIAHVSPAIPGTSNIGPQNTNYTSCNPDMDVSSDCRRPFSGNWTFCNSWHGAPLL